MRLSQLAAVVWIASALALAGCSSEGSSIDLIESSDGVLAVTTGGGGGGDALVEGVVAQSEQRCWGVMQPDEGFLLIVWPAGTELDDAGLSLPDAATPVFAGDTVRVSGAEIRLEAESEIASSCGDAETAFQAWAGSAEP